MSDLRPAPAPAGWYSDPTGLPQQRWWNGMHWTHDVSAPRQNLAELPAPQQPGFARPAIAAATADPTHATPAPTYAAYQTAPAAVPDSAIPTTFHDFGTARFAAAETLVSPSPAAAQFALPATSSLPADAFPTRRQLRERLAAEAAAAAEIVEPHPAAPFAMPPAPVSATHQPAHAAVSAPGDAAVSAVSVAPATLEPVAAVPVAAAPVAAATPVEKVLTEIQRVEPTRRGGTPQPATAATSQAAVTTPAVDAAPVPELRPVTAPLDKRPVASLVPELEASSTTVPYQPFGMIPKVRVGQSAPPEKASTWAAWLLAVLPVAVVGVAVLVVTQGVEFYSTFVQAGLLFIYVIASLALAVRDRRDLVDAGHQRPAHPAWALLTPLVYLAVRANAVHRETGRGTAPLWLALAVVVGIAVTGVLLPEWSTLVLRTTSLL